MRLTAQLLLLVSITLVDAAISRAGAPDDDAAELAKIDTEDLIDKLTQVTRLGFGYSATFSGDEFLPYQGTGEVHTLILGGAPPHRSVTLEALVRQGAAAVPILLQHLDDRRNVQIPPLHFTACSGCLSTTSTILTAERGRSRH